LDKKLLNNHYLFFLETIAATVKDTGGVYFVPAFSGLFAPYWRSDARGKIIQISKILTKKSIFKV
jgi:glycerol kinase